MSTSCYRGQCIVVFGTASLQRYIFQSNRLKENIGASYLTAHWLGKGLVSATQASTSGWEAYEENPCRDQLENPVNKDKEVNLIYIGGGNAALLCQNQDIANEVVTTWSCKVLKHAPGLRVVVGYGIVKNSLAEAYREALNDLERCEEAPSFGSALYSLPVVRTCISTGQPASEPRQAENNRGDEWISQSAAHKQDASGTEKSPGPAQEYIEKRFKSVLKKTDRLPKLRFALKFDEELGGRKGESHIAIVHADGNEMGDRLNQVIDKENQEDNEFLHNLRAFSASTTHLSHKALKKTLQHLKNQLPLDALDNLDDVFPLRPIVYGGDDLTFVCDGRVGLDLAVYYLRQFSKDKIKVCGKDEPVDACAGVAIVPTKFPFARAYSFADELCGLAKAHRRYNNKSKGSWLDFQIIQEGATRSIMALREAQYRSLEKGRQRLDQRPYEVSIKSTEKPQGWDLFVQILKEFQSKRWPRSRAKGLLQALVQGPASTKTFIEYTRWSGLQLPPPESETGWTSVEDEDKTTPYFDPLEALDFYMEIKETTDPTTLTKPSNNDNTDKEVEE